MNNGRICVSVCGETADETLAQIERAAGLADIVEIRFDCLDPSEIASVLDRLCVVNTPLLLTYRPAEQGVALIGAASGAFAVQRLTSGPGR